MFVIARFKEAEQADDFVLEALQFVRGEGFGRALGKRAILWLNSNSPEIWDTVVAVAKEKVGGLQKITERY